MKSNSPMMAILYTILLFQASNATAADVTSDDTIKKGLTAPTGSDGKPITIDVDSDGSVSPDMMIGDDGDWRHPKWEEHHPFGPGWEDLVKPRVRWTDRPEDLRERYPASYRPEPIAHETREIESRYSRAADELQAAGLYDVIAAIFKQATDFTQSAAWPATLQKWRAQFPGLTTEQWIANQCRVKRLPADASPYLKGVVERFATPARSKVYPQTGRQRRNAGIRGLLVEAILDHGLQFPVHDVHGTVPAGSRFPEATVPRSEYEDPDVRPILRASSLSTRWKGAQQADRPVDALSKALEAALEAHRAQSADTTNAFMQTRSAERIHDSGRRAGFSTPERQAALKPYRARVLELYRLRILGKHARIETPENRAPKRRKAFSPENKSQPIPMKSPRPDARAPTPRRVAQDPKHSAVPPTATFQNGLGAK